MTTRWLGDDVRFLPHSYDRALQHPAIVQTNLMLGQRPHGEWFAGAGQQLFYPPNVSGWDFTRWLDTSTAKARWEIASYVTAKAYPNPWPGSGEAKYSETEDPPGALANAFAYWGNPALSDESRGGMAAAASAPAMRPSSVPRRHASAASSAAPSNVATRMGDNILKP